MDNYVLSEFLEHQKFIGLVCLLLAAKSEEIDEAVPTIKDLLKIFDLSSDLGVDMRFKEEFDPKDVTKAYRNFASMYCKLEFLIFENIEFNTIRPTAVTFINVFQSVIVTSDDVLGIKSNVNLTELKTLGDLRVSANTYLQELLEIIIKDIEFFNILPSKLATAVVGATRKLLNIKQYWNDSIEQVSRYKIDDVRPLMLTLIEKRNKFLYDQKEATNNDIFVDSGYISPSAASVTSDESKKTTKKRRLNRPPIIYEAFVAP